MSHEGRSSRSLLPAREHLAGALVAIVLAAAVFGWSGTFRRSRDATPSLDDPSATLPVDPQVVIDSLDNGLRYYIRPNSYPEKTAELRLVVNAGSVLEDDDQRGLAHAVEHMAFRGTEHFPGTQLVEYLQSLGMRPGDDLNAYTSFDETVYRLTVPLDRSDALERAFSILADWAHGVRFDSTEAARERGVVFEEWRDGRDAGRRLSEARTAALLGGSRYAVRPPIGDTATLTRFDVVAMRRFYGTWYRPDLMAVVAVGEFPASRVRRMIERYFGAIPRAADAPARPAFPVTLSPRPRAVVLSDSETPRARVALWRLEPADAPHVVRDMRARIAREMFDAMLDARLAELARRDDTPLRTATTAREELTRDVDAHIVYADVPESEILPGLDALATELERVRRHGFTREELERERRVLLRQAEQELTFEEIPNSANLAGDYVSHFLRGEPILSRETDDSLYALLLPAIHLDEVNRVAAAMGRDSGLVVVVSTNGRAPGAADSVRVLAALAAARARDVQPYTAPPPLPPLIARRPDPGRIVTERELPLLQMTEWTLSNGMRVLLKPTSFRAHEVRLLAWAPGGASLANDDDYLSAYLADRVVLSSGIGGFDATQLDRMLDGSSARVRPEIDDVAIALRGRSDFAEVVQLFQLLHLYLTAPRADTAAFDGLRRQLAQSMRARTSDPDAAFFDTLSAVLGQHHPREVAPTPAQYEAMSLDRALAFYRARMENGSNFTVAIVGAFTPSDFRELVETYLASLPTGSREEPRDVGIHYARGPLDVVVRRGIEPKADTRIVFTGAVTPTSSTLAHLHVLREILAVTLDARIRDSLGGTYGVEVSWSIDHQPDPEYAFTVSFTADPTRVDSLARVAIAEIDRFRTTGPSRQELANAKAAEARELAQNFEDNEWWLDQIESHLRLGWPLEELLERRRTIRAMTPESLRDAARRYLDPRAYVRVTRVPER